LQQINSEKKRIVLTSHKNPDGDAIGSSLAMMHYLAQKGHEVVVVIPNEIPSFISWLSGNESIIVYDNNKVKADVKILEAELLFALDYNAFHRTGTMQTILEESKAIKILIDHHLNPAVEFDFIYSITEASSTSELVYGLIAENNDLHFLNKTIAENIYVGIVTDTGSFSYSCNKPETYEITKNLMLTGIDAELIHRKVYDTFSEERLRLLGYSLTEGLTVLKEYRTAYIVLSKDVLERFKYQAGDTEGIVNYALSIDIVNFAVLFTERDGLIRISFRSKKGFQVNEFAKQHFDGGGHANAAGGNSYVSMNETINNFNTCLENYKNDLNY